MKIVTTILIIFYAYLHVAENTNLLEDTVSNIGEVVSNVTENLIPNCVFGVESVSMVLYTKDIPYGKHIKVEEACDFDPTKPIFFLVHGFISNPNYTNSYKLSEALVKRDSTVFSLDWTDAACTTGLPVVKFLGYPSAVQNTREIGEHMAEYVTWLIEKCNVPLKNMTFIGHSLGAHVCGFAAKNIQNKNNITVPLLVAVDPAQPLFLLNECDERVCETDAITVIVLHASPLGFDRPIGDVDLYFNGGKQQPQCFIDISCSHSMPVLYLALVMENDNNVFPGVSTSYWNIKLFRVPPYPTPNTTDCFVMDSTIFDKDRFNKLKRKVYYMFVNSDTLFTQESFSCQD